MRGHGGDHAPHHVRTIDVLTGTRVVIPLAHGVEVQAGLAQHEWVGMPAEGLGQDRQGTHGVVADDGALASGERLLSVVADHLDPDGAVIPARDRDAIVLKVA